MALNSINVANTFDAKLQLTLWHRKEPFSSAVPSYLYFMKFGTLISTWKNKIISEKEKNDIIELRKSWWIFFQDFYERFHWSDRWLRAINDGFSCHWEPQLKELLFGVFVVVESCSMLVLCDNACANNWCFRISISLYLYVKLNDILLRWNDVSFIFNKTTHTAASIPIVFL